MLRIIAVITLFSLNACDGNALRDGRIKQQRGDGSASPEPDLDPKTNPPPPLPETITPWAPLPDSAVVPVAVSGASLFCYREGSVNCLASDSKGLALSFKPFKVYYSDSRAQIWVPTSFMATAKASTWAIQVPETINDKEVGILLLSDDNYYLANWISPMPESPLNLVEDGSFETIKIDSQNPESTRFLIPSAAMPWKARIPQATNCYPLIEQSSVDYSAIPAAQNGKQWVQLTSPCEQGLVSQRTKVAISQALTLKVGHCYELSFYYQAPLGASKQTELAFSHSPDIYTNFTVTQDKWTLYKTMFTATQTQQTLDFVENGLVANSGTAIDNISVIEIGSPNTKILLNPNPGVKDLSSADVIER